MKTFVMLLLMLPFAGPDDVQYREITGTVTASDNGVAIPGVDVLLKGTKQHAKTDRNGQYTIKVPGPGATLIFFIAGFHAKSVVINNESVVNVSLEAKHHRLEAKARKLAPETTQSGDELSKIYVGDVAAIRPTPGAYPVPPQVILNTEEYAQLSENVFYGVDKNPLSTFSIDVDAASYTNVRRFINNGQAVPKEAVRIEEMINYFTYDYKVPSGEHPFSVVTEISAAPWNSAHQLVLIGLQGKKIPVEKLPASNLVFLIDVSGSMNQPNKLPLVKKSFQILVDQLRAQDHVSIVVYAGAAGILLEPTPGDEKRKISAALEKLVAGGSTAGGAGLHMAYGLAKEHFKEHGNNRVILATDGDFNVGESSNQAMEDLIEQKRKDGIFLTVLGFGMGNLKDSKMEILADKGNGNYAYIDNFTEARKVLVNEFAGTLFTIAKDVKLQVEFNPASVLAYRLIGYENRQLQDEDFNNDRKDAGDLGSGHTVTALYEIIPSGVRSSFYAIDPLKYQPAKPIRARDGSQDWLTVKLRYKEPAGAGSRLMEHVVAGEPVALARSSENFRWAASVASFGMLLTQSQYIGGWRCTDVIALAQASRGHDREGYRSEFINIVKTYGLSESTRVDEPEYR